MRNEPGSGSAPAHSEKPAGWQSPTLGWGYLVGSLFGITFTSRMAFALASLSALGFLAFLGFVPLPGMQRCFGFSGFFGLIGVAFIVEMVQRHRAGTRASAGTAPPPRAAGSGCLRVLLILAIIAVAGFAVMFVSYLAAAVPRPQIAAGEDFPTGAHIGRNDHSVLVEHDSKNLHYVFYYPGDFGSSSSGTQNVRTRSWVDEGALKLKNGRTFGYRREGRYPDELTVNGARYDLLKGRVFVVRDDGTLEQLGIFPSRDEARDPEAMSRVVENKQRKSVEQPVEK